MSPDASRCPLCGAGNDCAMTQDGGPCWCAGVDFPAALLERVPPQARNKACICRACAEAAGRQDTVQARQ